VARSTRTQVTLDPALQFNPTGAFNTARRVNTGAYEVTFPGLGLRGTGGGNVLVTAYGSDNAVCRAGLWKRSANGVDQIVNVGCTKPDGTPLDSGFTVRFVR
jgi:hypothetical protein